MRAKIHGALKSLKFTRTAEGDKKCILKIASARENLAQGKDTLEIFHESGEKVKIHVGDAPPATGSVKTVKFKSGDEGPEMRTKLAIDADEKRIAQGLTAKMYAEGDEVDTVLEAIQEKMFPDGGEGEGDGESEAETTEEKADAAEPADTAEPVGAGA